MIDQLLKEIKEDKCDNFTTTSFQFKRDIWHFFQGFENKIAVEFGTHKGQTTRILSFLFKKVYTININDNQEAKKLNLDRDNIVYIDNFDLYSYNALPIEENVDAFLIDAGHDYHHVISDINRVFSMYCMDSCYIIFDDYGMNKFKDHVKKAVDEMVKSGALTIIKEIGHKSGHSFGGDPPRVLSSSEGIITKINWQK